MLKMMEAFSYASEYCDVALWVKASNLRLVSLGGLSFCQKLILVWFLVGTSSRIVPAVSICTRTQTYQVKLILMWFSSTGNRKSSSSSCP